MSKSPNKAPGRDGKGGSGKRAMGYMLMVGAGLAQPRTRYDEGLSPEEPRIPRASAVGVPKRPIIVHSAIQGDR